MTDQPPTQTAAGEREPRHAEPGGLAEWRVTEGPVSDLVEQVVGGEMVSNRAGHPLITTGFATLDRALAGGFHVGDLVILGGLPASGKTIAALQWARNMARDGNRSLFLCYEHDVATMLGRLLSLEIGSLGTPLDGDDDRAVAEAIAYTMNGAGDPESRALDHPVVKAAMAQMATYAERLVLAQAPNFCDLDVIASKSEQGDYDVVMVDYLQKVPSLRGLVGIDRYTHTVEGIKNMALENECLVVALSAVDSAALSERRLGIDGLRGAHALAHEADVVITINNKLRVVSRSHLAFDSTLFDAFSRQSVFTIEKNRRGMAPLNVEFEKDFARFRFHPKGRYVAEKLIDHILVTE